MRWPVLRELAERLGPPVWFAGLSAAYVFQLVTAGLVGIDARTYYRGAAAWLAGGDPWSAVGGGHFAGAPTILLAYAPFTVIPEDLFVACWTVLAMGCAVVIVRSLRLPPYWLLFPPLTEGILVGNPDVLLLATLVAGAGAVAPFLKVYAVAPLMGELRLRATLGALGLGLLTVAAAPGLWQRYLAEFGSISDRLLVETAGGLSAYGRPLLLIPTVIAIAIIAAIDRRAAGWLIVPALWPASQFHYGTLAMPLASPWLGVLFAIPLPGMPAVASIAWACHLLRTKGGRGQLARLFRTGRSRRSHQSKE